MIRNFEELEKTSANCGKCLDAKFTGADGKRHVVLCGGTGCLSSHSHEIKEEFEKLIAEKGLGDKVTVNQVGCFGFCSQGPFVKIYPEDTLYRMVHLTDVEEIVEKDLVGGEVVERLLYVDPVTQEKVRKQDDINFYKKQVRIALHGCGSLNPEDINENLGAGAFVCGEETALLNSIEGQRGMPRPRPPFPAVKGLWQKPTIINNVETLACVPYIMREGASEFAKYGTEKSKGTKVFALGGKINNVGLVEIPMGTTLRELVYDIGGGIPHDKEFKAIQTGGPSGGCLTKDDLDAAIDYDNLIAKGSMMGSGGAIVMDEDNCMVDVAKFYMEFICDESCGKCSPCRIGTKRMLEILTKITDGKGTMNDLNALEELAANVKSNSLCGLGQTAPNPVLSTLAHFKDEYIAHIRDKECPAHVCKHLMRYSVDPEKCKKCSLCARHCPVEAISGVVGKEPFVIDTSKCIKCGMCIASCKFGAISKK